MIISVTFALMKKVLSYLFSVLLVGVYMLSTMGYGIHQCAFEGSNDVILLFGETPCEYVHAKKEDARECRCCPVHISADGTCCGVAHDGCCTTETFVLSQDQVNSNNDFDQTPFLDCAYLVHNSTIFSNGCESQIYSGVIFPTGFVVKDCAIHVINSQFRI